MKKISLKNLNLKVEELSREQLKDVFGGSTPGGTNVCKCGPNADCVVIGAPGVNCTTVCQGFEGGC